MLCLPCECVKGTETEGVSGVTYGHAFPRTRDKHFYISTAPDVLKRQRSQQKGKILDAFRWRKETATQMKEELHQFGHVGFFETGRVQH